MITNCLNSKNFGVPQNRERCFIVGHLRGRCTNGVFPIEGTAREDNLEQVAQMYGTKVEPNPMAGRIYSSDGLIPSLDTCQGGNRMPKIAIMALRGRESDSPDSKYIQTAEVQSSGLCNTLTSTPKDNLVYQEIVPEVVGGVGDKNFGKQWRQGNRIYDGDKIATALESQPVGNAGGNTNLYAIRKPNSSNEVMVRKLTPKECFRLQGWTDDYFAKAEMVNSNAQLYKQAGNGVTVNVIKAIAEKMTNGDDDENNNIHV